MQRQETMRVTAVSVDNLYDKLANITIPRLDKEGRRYFVHIDHTLVFTSSAMHDAYNVILIVHREYVASTPTDTKK